MGANVIQRIVATGLLVAVTVLAENHGKNHLPAISGYASFEAGEIMKGFSTRTGDLQRVWLETGYMGLRTETAVSDRLRILVGGEAQLLFSFRRSEGQGIDEYLGARQPKTVIIIKNGEALYTIGSADHPRLQLEAGFFPYKYHPEVRNLGEYLFRTFCYPSCIINQFDRPYADLVGLRVGNHFSAGPGVVHHDLIFNTSMPGNLMDFWPTFDWTLSYLADYSIPRLFCIGAGIQWWDLITVGLSNSQVGPDPTTPDPALMGGRPFTFAGTKAMARFSFDVKGLFPVNAPLPAMLGKEDLKVYGETAITGLKNYPDPDTARNAGYDGLPWRMPVMLGVNLPAFTFLDVLSLELEFQDSPYPNSYKYVYYKMLPLPPERLSHAKWKWSLYAKKTIGSHISIIGQAARDHLLPFTAPNVNEFADKTDVILRNTDWWWTGKIQFNF